MNEETINVRSFEEAYRILENFPINAHKCVDAALKKAGAVIQKRVRSGLPATSWKKDVKNKLFSKPGTSSMAKIRISGFSFTKAYWSNYGTLAGRDSTHNFRKDVRKGKENKKGIVHKNFFEKAVETAEPEAIRVFEDTFIKLVNKVLDGKD